MGAMNAVRDSVPTWFDEWAHLRTAPQCNPRSPCLRTACVESRHVPPRRDTRNWIGVRPLNRKVSPLRPETLGSRLATPKSLWLFEKVSCRNLQRPRDLVDNCNRWISNPALDATDVGAVQLTLISELFLGEAPLLAQSLQVLAKSLFDIHPAKGQR